MAEIYCYLHFDKKAVGICSGCQKTFCADCLDVESGPPICPNCKKKKTASFLDPFSATQSSSPKIPGSTPQPKLVNPPLSAASVPLDFKGKGLEDDPLGLFKQTTPPGPEKQAAPPTDKPPKTAPPADQPPAEDQSSPGVMPWPTPLGDLLAPSRPSNETKRTVSNTPDSPMFDIDKLLLEPKPLRPPFPKVDSETTEKAPFPDVTGLPVKPVPVGVKKNILGFSKVWAKFILRRAYQQISPISDRLKVPPYLLLILIVLLVVVAIVGVKIMTRPPSVRLTEKIQPVYVIRVTSSQVSEMDITTFMEMQNRLTGLGFKPVLQMTVPQLPSPNFFDVWMKPEAEMYAEILKVPGKITPQLSFVTVFTNGVWYASNAWRGNDKEQDYLIGEYQINATADQLYIQHVQGVARLKKDKNWKVQIMNENRYVTALTDHLRWYLATHDVQSYKAEFNLWH
jgi:hypothetical protein